MADKPINTNLSMGESRVRDSLDPLLSGDMVTKNFLEKRKHITQLSGRFDLFASGNWSCWSDQTFGFILEDWDVQLGNGATPDIDWDALGVMFPAGTVLKRIFIKHRANNNTVGIVEFYARAHTADLLAGNPIDSNAEIGAVEVFPATQFDLDAGGADANDMRATVIDLNNYTFEDNAFDLHLMCRGLSLPGNRQLRCTLYIEYLLPVDFIDSGDLNV